MRIHGQDRIFSASMVVCGLNRGCVLLIRIQQGSIFANCFVRDELAAVILVRYWTISQARDVEAYVVERLGAHLA